MDTKSWILVVRRGINNVKTRVDLLIFPKEENLVKFYDPSQYFAKSKQAKTQTRRSNEKHQTHRVTGS